ncbi:hypothetical protein MUN76_15270 [Leucobacter rhizosphaerae]|uniref:Antitoxin VbhA domain-containing protein n=1 Tax=Leucobacter rhizosphaerae TaxID=2932245 RepID=A0ABY4FW21_9MICO|nr:hypothetical protein [Leucobacter rhizosphaerae]UOQ60369.1 hypothetical protein MUN76_15270 [Leucobacter rhizosphaerae]
MAYDMARLKGASSQIIFDIADRYGHEPAAGIEARLRSAIVAAGQEPSEHVATIARRIADGDRGEELFR